MSAGCSGGRLSFDDNLREAGRAISDVSNDSRRYQSRATLIARQWKGQLDRQIWRLKVQPSTT